MQAFFKQPNANAMRNLVAAPFQLELWIAYFITLIIIILSVKLMSVMLIRHRKYAIIHQSYPGDNEYTHDVVLAVMAAACQKCK